MSNYLRSALYLAIGLGMFFCSPDLTAQKKKKKANTEVSSHPFDSVANGMKFRSLGPAFMSGRVADIAIDPEKPSTWYVAIGSGGVWKTENAGTTWKPLFDGQKVYSIGCISIDPNNRHSIWVGTGENVGGRHVGFGDGIYHSQDGGKSWKNMGLKASEHISKIIVHPGDPNTIWVAVQGPLWSSGGERGVYKTTDGGKTWNNTLSVNEWTGATELCLDPRNPDRIYAATWQRHRTVAAYIGGGVGSNLYRSDDGGESWTKLAKGIPASKKGKIGLCISPQQPDVLYAAIELNRRTGAVYRSSNRGASWQKMSSTVSGGTGPHYYQELYASPHQFDKIYLADVRVQISEDGGRNFKRMNERNKHSDNHAIAFRQDDPDFVLVGSDGGLYETLDGEKNWRYIANLPTVQYYKLAVDDSEPFYNIYGGTQDNNTHGGPSRTDNNSGIRNADWFIVLGGDGHQPATEPGNPNIIYAESQQGHLSRIDMSNGERTNIKPNAGKGEDYERYNWDAPILVSPHSPSRIYFASQRVWRSDNRGDSWTAISGDLTRNEKRLELEIMGAKQGWDNAWDVYAMSNYNSITSLAESPLQEGLLYAGTDDGLIQVSENGGDSWRKIEVGSLPGVPATAFVNDIKADLHNASTVYICLDNHKYGDYRPYVFKSENKGASWVPIEANLPEKTLIWRLVQDHVEPGLLFLGTEFGIYCSLNGGEHWTQLKSGLPTISIRDLAIQKRENDLVAASFGRGFYILDDYSPLRKMAKDIWTEEAVLIEPRKALWYMPRTVLGWSPKGAQGDGYYTAPNPDFGATFSYLLKDGFKSLEAERKSKEKKASKAGEPADFPSWETLEEEKRSLAPQVYLDIMDSEGTIIRSIKAKNSKGLHRISWNLRHNNKRAISTKESFSYDVSSGLWAVPGTYRAQLILFDNGKYRPLGNMVEFEVERINEGSLKGNNMELTNKYWRDIEKLQEEYSAMNIVLRQSKKQWATMQVGFHRIPEANFDVEAKLLSLKAAIDNLDQALNGLKSKREVGEKNAPSVGSRLSMAASGTYGSSYGPTEHHLNNFKLAKEELTRLANTLRAIANEQIPGLMEDLRKAGVPYLEGQKY